MKTNGTFPARAASTTAVLLQVDQVEVEVPTADEVLRILPPVSFDLSHGESLAVVGPSGSGKTTLLSVIAGLKQPTRGRVVFRGEEISRMKSKQTATLRREFVGFVFQDFRLIRSLSVLENVMVPAYLRGENGAEGRATALLTSLGMAGRLRALPDTLSGGEQQRVAIARALLPRPTLLICDEPTGSLDVDTAALVGAELVRLVREHGAAMLLATHDPELAQACERRLTLGADRAAPADARRHE